MIIVVSDNDLKKFEEKLVETNKKYDATDVDFDSYDGVYIARFTVDQWEKGCFKINIKIKNKYICEKCKSFIGALKEDGYIYYNPKCKFASNGRDIKITCKCGEVHTLKL